MRRLRLGRVGLLLIVLAGPTGVSRAACIPIAISQQPQSMVVLEGCRATFQVRAGGSEPIFYQWFVDGIAIPDATNASYTTPPVSISSSGNRYQVFLSNACSTDDSVAVPVFVSLDVVPPRLAGARSGLTPDRIVLSFQTSGCVTPEGGLDPATATDRSNYTLSGGLQVAQAELACQGTNVILTTATRPTEGGTYTVTVNNVMDVRGNMIAPSSQTSLRAHALLRGALRRDILWSLPSGTIAGLTNDARFPYCLQEGGQVTAFEAPRHIGDYYGQRLSGLLLPPQTTNYTFVLASDDESALYLSTDDNPANKQLIALGTQPTPPASWACAPASSCPNWSSPILLEAGRRYYVEAVMAESTRGDHLAVTWNWSGLPLNDLEPIPGSFLASYAAAGAQVTILQPPQNVTVSAGDRAGFTVIAEVSPAGTPVTYQWQRNSQDILGANESTYLTPPLQESDNLSVYRCFVRGPGANRISANAILTVTPDRQGPRLTGAAGLSLTRVIAMFSEPVMLSPAAEFSLSSGQPVTSRYLDPDDRAAIELTVSGPPFLTPGVRYTLTVRHLADLADNALVPDPSVAPFLGQGSLPQDPRALRLTSAGSQIVLEWVGSGVLERSSHLVGPWEDLAGARSPYVAEARPAPGSGAGAVPGLFYRVRSGF